MMKKLKLFFACLLMAVLSIGQMWGAEVTFTPGTDTGETSVTKSGVTCTMTTMNNASYYQIYASQSGTFEVSSGNITKIEFTCTASGTSKYGPGNASANVGSYSYSGNKGTWTGEASSVTISSTAQVRMSTLTITVSTGSSEKTLSVDPTVIDFGTVEQNAVVASQTVEVSFANLTGSVAYSGLSSPFTASGTISSTGDEITIAANTANVGNYSQTLTVQSTADSKSAEVTVKMNVVEPFDGLKLTFDVSSNPGEWPTTNSTTTTNYTYTLNEVDYTFALNNVKCNSGYLMLTSVAKLGLPAISGYKLVKVEATNSSGCSTTTQVSVSSSDATKTDVTGGTAQTWGTTSTKYTYNLSGTEENTMYYLWIANKNCQLVELTLYYEEAEAATVAQPTISGADNFLTSTEVTMECSTEGAAIYYTITESAKATPATSGDWNAYDNSNKPSFSATTTVWAAAKLGDDWSAVAEQTFTKATILTPAGALAIINGWSSNQTSTEDYYVQGTISQIDEVNVNSFATYYISADGTTTDQLQVYKGLWVNGDNFTSADQIQLGDDVLIKGKLRKYGSYKELDQNNEVISYKLKARLAWSVASYNADIDNPSANVFPTLTNTNSVAVTYSSTNTDAATISNEAGQEGEITLVGIGETTIKATFTGNDTYKANEVSYTLNVASSVTKADISFEENGGSDVADLTAQTNLPNPLPTITKAGYNFGGWYKDSEFNTLATAGAAVESTDPITLYAKWLDPYTVAEALAIIDANPSGIENQYVAGIISQIDSYNGTYHSITYWISADGTTTNQLQVYSGLIGNAATALGKEAFSAKEDLELGDEVVVTGTLKLHNSTTYEFDKNNTIYSFNRPVVAVTGIDLTESTAEVEVGSTVTLHASVVPGNATDQGIVWSVTSGSDKASVDENGVVTGTAAGEAVIRAASHEDASIYEECTVTVTAVDPTVHHVTFIAGTDQSDETSITKDGITISASTFNNASYYQCYSGAAMTVSSTVGNITKIELTCTASGTAKYGPGNWDFTGYSYDGTNGLWAGSAETVEFGNASQQVRMTLITVTYKEDNRAAAGLSWSTDAVVLTVGETFTAPTLNNPNSIASGEITIASDNTELAQVDNGVVSLVADATGTATITATFNGNASYKPATVSYNITVNEASLDNVTFDSSEDHAESGETTITKSGFTLSFTSGSMDGTQAEYRLYKSQTMTLSSTDYLIKKIEFTCTSGNPISGFADATGLDKDNNEWTGESNTVELTASNAQVRMTKIKVFYVEDTRAAAGLAWNPADDIELTVGGAFSAPALLNPNGIDAAEISIASSNTDVATVTAGVVALVADATGEATITATFAGNASYKPATVSYKITVNPAYSIYVQPSLNVNFGSVNQNAEVADKSITVTLTGVDAATLTLEGTGASAFTISPAAAMTASGDITISASSANLGTFAATLTISDDANNAESKVVHLSLTVNEVVVPETPVSTTSEWVAATDGDLVDGAEVLIVGVHPTTSKVYAAGEQGGNNRAAVEASVDGEGVLTPGDNTMSFILEAQEGGKFALRTSNGKYLCAASSGNNYLRTQDVLDDNGKWTLTTTSAVANGSYTRNTMFFNSSSSLFACYASSTTTQQPIAFYVPKPAPAPEYETVRSGLEINRYYTVCLPKKVTAIKGASFWTLKSKSQDGATAYLEEETNNLPFAAGKPFIIQATAENLEVIYEGDATEDAGTNGALHGTLVYMDAAALADAGPGVYMLFSNELRPVGENNHLDANRAYVLLSELSAVPEAPQNAPGRRVVAMPMEKDVTTDINALNAAEAPVKMIIDGNLFILCGEKLYDATGRLVK